VTITGQWRKGDRLTARWVQRVTNFIENFTVSGGAFEFDGRTPRLYVKSGTSTFSGVAYVAGVKTSNLKTEPAKPWIRCNLRTAVVTQDYGPPPVPFPHDEEWYEKANTAGDIHIPRAG